MKNLKLIYLLTAITAVVFFMSCEKDILDRLSQEKFSLRTSSNPILNMTDLVTKESNYLVFSSFESLDAFLSQSDTISQESLNDWENSIGFKSQRRTFYEVMAAEDVINDSLENLSPQDKAVALSQTPFHSSIHDMAIQSGLLRYYGQGSETYFDYSIVEPRMAGVVNSEGVVKVGGQLIKFTNDSLIYIFKDGTLAKLQYAESKNDDYEDEFIKVIKTRPYNPESIDDQTTSTVAGLCYSSPHENNFSKSNPWHYIGGNKRIKVQLEGLAKANFGSSECVNGTTCKFQLTTQAQKLNFWGRWVYSSKFAPPFKVTGATWTYTMALMPTCSDYPTLYYNNIYGGINPKPVMNYYYYGTNHGFIPLHPSTSGWWVWDDKKICKTIDVINYNIPVNFNGDSYWGFYK